MVFTKRNPKFSPIAPFYTYDLSIDSIGEWAEVPEVPDRYDHKDGTICNLILGRNAAVIKSKNEQNRRIAKYRAGK